jgi:aspartate kinase
MTSKSGPAYKVFESLAKADINIKMIDQGSSELNIIIAIEEKDYEKAISALYNGLV